MTLKLDDQRTFQLTKLLYNEFKDEENQKKLDQDNLEQFKKEHIKPLYPHETIVTENGEKTIKKYSCNKFCCQLNPGSFFCFNSQPPDDVYKGFGLGACLYFKFLRHTMCFFVFLSVICLVSVLLYYMVSINNGFQLFDSYQNFIFAGSIGSLSAEKIKCEYNKIQSGSSTLTLSCQVGTVETYSKVMASNQSLNSLHNCRKEIDKINDTQSQYQINYTEQRNCNNDMNQCNITLTNINKNYPYVSYSYKCINSQYPLGDLVLTQQYIIYITVAIDFGIVIFLIFFLISEGAAEDVQINYFKSKQLCLHDFAIKIDGFHAHTFDNEFDFFAKGMDQKIQDMDGFIDNIVQVKVLETVEMRKAIQKRRKKYQQLFNLIEYCFFEEMIDPNKYLSSNDFIKKCYGTTDEPAYIQYKKELQEGINKFMASKEMQIDEDDKIKTSCFVVMNNPKYKRTVFENASSSCFSKQLHVQERKYQISQPPVADMILWENKDKWTCLRVLFIWIITLGIIFSSYLLVGVAQAQKDKIGSNNSFGVDCEILYTPEQKTTYDANLNTISNAYIHCYCYYHYFQLFNFVDDTISNNCSDWRGDYFLFLGIPILISLGIVFYNLIISRFFKIMTKFEAHDQLTTQLYSYIIKRTFVLVMNMGLLMILLKLDWPGQFGDGNVDFLFQGTYLDVTSDWYLEIGIIIVLTLGINIFIPIFQMLLLGFLRWLRRMWDKRCCCVKTSQTTKKGYIDLYAGDVYPIEERYADILSILIITLAFSSVIPGLYIIACLSLVFMAICDKFLLFRVYQYPVNYTAKLQNKIYKTVFFTLILHTAAAIFLLSEPSLVVGENANLFSVNGEKRLTIIIETYYIIAYVVLFALLFLWAFLSATIIALIKSCKQKCKQHEMSVVRRDKLNTNYFDALNDYQIRRLKLSLEREVNKKLQTIKKDNYLKNQNDTESYFMRGTEHIHQRQIISRSTLSKLEKMKVGQKELKTRLIGKAGYEELFDDEVFNRQRKIRILDQHLKDLMKKNVTDKSESVQLQDIHLRI